jgi:hypothetical protein
LVAFLINAYITVVAFGRGTGKTHGVTATWVYDRAKKLNRSTGFILSITYAHLIDTIIPAMQKSWAEMGLVQGVHYWIREKPPVELELDEPITPVDDPKYFIFWVNGSVTKLVSMDRQALVNSKSFDYGAICEARKLPGVRIEDDVIPTIRGNGDVFGHLPEHGTILIESDLPKDVKGKWFLKYKKQMDQEDVNWIMACRRRIYDLQQLPASKRVKAEIEEVIEFINEVRKDLVHWVEAGTFDNIHALGEKALRYLRRTLSAKDYEVSVLNILHEEVEDCFYAGLEDDVHGYDAFNYSYIDSLEKLPKRDCRWDRDVNLNKPLDITIDYNLRHSCIDVYQLSGTKLRFLKHTFVLAPLTHLDMVDMICEYYEPHLTKEINFVFNSTFISGEQVKGRKSVRNDVEERFRKNGWKVYPKPIGQQMAHEDMYYHCEQVFKGQANYKFYFNRGNGCDVWYNACKQTTIRPNTKPPTKGKRYYRFYKDKSSERTTSGIPQQDATHSTESVDQIQQYYLRKLSTGKQGVEDFQAIG